MTGIRRRKEKSSWRYHLLLVDGYLSRAVSENG
jgi:hypothetical protein